jgi:hypothetical protein
VGIPLAAVPAQPYGAATHDDAAELLMSALHERTAEMSR